MEAFVVSHGDQRLSCGDRVRMYRLRDSAFRVRLGWDVANRGGLEYDEYDAPPAHYVLAKDHLGVLRGCWRLLPTSQGRYMLAQRFAHLLGGKMAAPQSEGVWEISRFAALSDGNTRYGFSDVSLRMMQAAVAFGMQRQIRQYVAVTTPAIDRLLGSIGVPFKRWGEATPCGVAKAVVLGFEIDDQLELALQAARQRQAQKAAHGPRRSSRLASGVVSEPSTVSLFASLRMARGCHDSFTPGGLS
jgi:acyl homoserine lactone synthase